MNARIHSCWFCCRSVFKIAICMNRNSVECSEFEASYILLRLLLILRLSTNSSITILVATSNIHPPRS